ncbi:MAG: hypothetical protein RMJ07_02400 [Nitrososphaerota archaeon]|nr:hypothetical protein [Candidatus Bathyarchaeota archaeon]MDW8048520.1 hypothetical protein [Nitrososphaerota archaeon]
MAKIITVAVAATILGFFLMLLPPALMTFYGAFRAGIEDGAQQALGKDVNQTRTVAEDMSYGDLSSGLRVFEEIRKEALILGQTDATPVIFPHNLAYIVPIIIVSTIAAAVVSLCYRYRLL